MKSLRFLVLILVSLLLISLAGSAATKISITPQNPTDNDDLTCSIGGVDPVDYNKYNFQWHVNGILDNIVGNTWIYPASRTKVNDYIVCAVFTPGGFFVGLSSVTIGPAQDTPPTAKITSPTDGSNFFTGTNINFNGLANDPDGDQLSVSWNFGDGTVIQNQLNPTHNYNQAGAYIVTLTSSDGKSAVTDKITVNILNQQGQQKIPPVAVINAKQNANVGELILFKGDNSFDADGNIVSYDWDFGDGTQGNGPILQHSYNAPGLYNVVLTVTDNDGLKGATVFFVNIQNNINNGGNQPPVALIDVGTNNIITGVPFGVSGARSFDPDGNIVSYDWDFGDGTQGKGIILQHTFAKSGVYTIKLTVTDNQGATGTVSVAVKVTDQLNQPPVAIIDTDNNFAYLGFPLKFSGARSFDPDGNIVSYDWDFGDEGIANGPLVQHTFFNKGSYNVKLKVTDDKGLSATQTLVIEAVNVNRGISYNKQRVNHNNVEIRDLRIAGLVPVFYKANYKSGESFVLLAKLVNEGNVDEVVNLKLTIPEFNYEYIINNLNVDASQVSLVNLNVQIPSYASPGLHVAKLEMTTDSGVDEKEVFWDFVVA